MEPYYRAIDLLKEIIRRPSVSREEGPLAQFLQQTWQAAGHSVNRTGNNLWITAPGFDTARPTLLLNSHIDTVRPVSGWSRDPFTPLEGDDGKLYGLGSNDAGASVVSLYEAFVLLSGRAQPYNTILLASSEEEVSGANGLRSVLPLLPPISFAVVGEPTGMQPAVAEKGLMVLDCIAEGKSGHAAREEGINAISKAMACIDWFHSYRFPKESPLLGAVRMSVTMIQAGTQHNVIPDRCNFSVDVRSNECYSNQELLGIIEQNVPCRITPRSLHLNSSSTAVDHPFVQRALMAGRQPFGSPTLSDQSLMSFPSVKIGPGDSSRSHTADEYVFSDQIREAISLYFSLLNGLSL